MSTPIELPGLDPHPPALAEALWAAYEALPSATRARAHHRREDGRPRFLNRLVQASSPYLLQHAFNPVSWHPWGEDAFALARDTDRPVLLSVGYSTCHWCHVMEHESFEDPEIAATLNTRFVPVKVDREERPDVDAVYMMATQLLAGGGGWPMTVALTPSREPFFAGTYFPARDGDRGARIGFLTVLERLSEAWRRDRERVFFEAKRLTGALEGAHRPDPPEGLSGDAVLHEAARFLARMFDPEHGGFGGAPKFPRPSSYELLLRYHRRSGDPAALEIVRRSLERMSLGGLYDHLGGGFARYSTDRAWLVPHFEKMLYDNAQLAALLVDAWRVTNEPAFARTARHTLDYALREMTAPEGGFYSATDADSEGVEGKYFVWTRAEILEHLGPDRGERFAEIYGVSDEGNFEGANILHLARPLEEEASRRGLSAAHLLAELEADRERLRKAREERVPPFLDDKVLTEWNAQMIGALARAGFALDEPRYLSAARRAADFLSRALREPSARLRRAFRNGRRAGEAVLEDYAFLTEGSLDLFEATAEPRWLEMARATADAMIGDFADAEEGGFFATPADAEPLPVRDKPSYDGAQPSGNSVAALALLRLEALTGEPRYGEAAEGTLRAFGGLLEKGATANPKMALALDWRLDRAKEILIVYTPEDPGHALKQVLRQTFVPNAVRVVADARELPSLEPLVPWVRDKQALGARATAYVCIAGTCRLPTHDPAELERQLQPEVPIEAPPLATKARPSPRG